MPLLIPGLIRLGFIVAEIVVAAYAAKKVEEWLSGDSDELPEAETA